ncbi:hypothetical protein GOV09_03120 [Candidatus Woesearchaeota archaeon]|nr:hypothetical protein [Candidatus Woesearchaeota archaeon]
MAKQVDLDSMVSLGRAEITYDSVGGFTVKMEGREDLHYQARPFREKDPEFHRRKASDRAQVLADEFGVHLVGVSYDGKVYVCDVYRPRD